MEKHLQLLPIHMSGDGPPSLPCKPLQAWYSIERGHSLLLCKSNVPLGTFDSLRSPRDPLAPHLAVPNRVLVGGPCITRHRHALTRSPAAAILLCDLSRMAAPALTSHTFGAGPFSRRVAEPINVGYTLIWSAATRRRFVRQRLVAAIFFNLCRDKSRQRKAATSRRTPYKKDTLFKDGSATRNEKGSPHRRSGGSERASSQSTQIAQQNRTTGERASAWGVVLYTPLRRGRDLAKRGEAQRRSREARARSGVSSDMSIVSHLSSLYSKDVKRVYED